VVGASLGCLRLLIVWDRHVLLQSCLITVGKRRYVSILSCYRCSVKHPEGGSRRPQRYECPCSYMVYDNLFLWLTLTSDVFQHIATYNRVDNSGKHSYSSSCPPVFCLDVHDAPLATCRAVKSPSLRALVATFEIYRTVPEDRYLMICLGSHGTADITICGSQESATPSRFVLSCDYCISSC
jgi:hypothetical protein